MAIPEEAMEQKNGLNNDENYLRIPGSGHYNEKNTEDSPEKK